MSAQRLRAVASSAAPIGAATVIASRDLTGSWWWAWSGIGVATAIATGVGSTIARETLEDPPKRVGMRACAIAILLALLPGAMLGAHGEASWHPGSFDDFGPATEDSYRGVLVVGCKALSFVFAIVSLGLMLAPPVDRSRRAGVTPVRMIAALSAIGLFGLQAIQVRATPHG